MLEHISNKALWGAHLSKTTSDPTSTEKVIHLIKQQTELSNTAGVLSFKLAPIRLQVF